MSRSRGIDRSFYLVLGFAALAAFILSLGGLTGQASAMKGSYYQGQLKAEQNKCKAKKGKKAKSACLKGAKGKATKATQRAMRTVNGFYGFNLKGAQIPAANGTLIWSQRETGVRANPEASATYNVLYSSKSSPGNRKVVVSGTVMVPKGDVPQGGWPVISWAHGTVGLADQCAPSRNLGSTEYYGSESGQLIRDWLKAGYAVAATDYEGLGTPGIHPYLIGVSEGRGVLDIVTAARQLDSGISRRGVLAGHSQGGQAILFAADLATTSWRRDTNYLGTVSYAPVSNLNQQAPLIFTFDNQPGQYGISALALSILRGAVAGDPAIRADGILTPKALEQYPKTGTLCYGGLAEDVAGAELKPSQILKSGWAATSDGRRFTEQLVAMNPNVSVGAPVLIPQGLADTTVLAQFTDELVRQLETTNPAPGLITYQKYPGATHSSILPDSETEVSLFISALFNP